MYGLSQEYITAIIHDFLQWKQAELELISAEDMEHSVIFALSRFNFASINTEKGYRVMRDILNPQNEAQGTAARFRRFVSICMLKYGKRVVNQYKKLCCAVLEEVYGVPKKTINDLHNINDCMWVSVLFVLN